ncbi:transglutaminase-like cysteine peptidase [Halomonas pacifica]|nr:transglutaminase-like cysteine peptidase [Halomonas pacifica]MDC8805543.1 transglutaminase-like cysteine peptidase [Halomonas pacifica]
MHAPAPSALTRRRFLMAGAGVLLAGLLGPPAATAIMDASRLRQQMRSRYGEPGLAALEAWLNLLSRLRGADLLTRLGEVNDFFNRRIRWVDDLDAWGREDYWATPLEALGNGRGDCEDYSIAKYLTLKQLGVPGERLRMIYVRARIGRSRITQAHMVLGYYAAADAEPLILDNLVPSLTPAARRIDLDPVFSFNSDGLWVGDASSSRGNPLARLSRWRGALARMEEQGFL